jgi:hypothetical protein
MLAPQGLDEILRRDTLSGLDLFVRHRQRRVQPLALVVVEVVARVDDDEVDLAPSDRFNRSSMMTLPARTRPFRVSTMSACLPSTSIVFIEDSLISPRSGWPPLPAPSDGNANARVVPEGRGDGKRWEKSVGALF